MEKILKFKKYILLGIVLSLLGTFSYIYYQRYYLKESEDTSNEISIIDNDLNKEKITTSITTKSTQFFDIKGAVKNPGVYSFDNDDKVIDAINKAGGLTKNGTTDNINLSQKLKNEMVIYIFTKSELTTKNHLTTTNPCNCEVIEVNNCIKDDVSKIENNDNKEESTNGNSKVNINTATINELTTISGIGESKAKAIIEYRNNNGLFKTIDDIRNVSGLGDALFDKIKDYITV